MKKTIKVLLIMLIILAMFIGTKVLATEGAEGAGTEGSGTEGAGTEESGTETGEGTEELTWTDFSNVELEIELNNSKAFFKANNLEKIENHYYFFYITADKTKPEFNTDYNSRSGWSPFDINEITNYVELNQDLYVWVVEMQVIPNTINNTYKFVVEGRRLERPDYPIGPKFFRNTVMSYDNDIIALNAPSTQGRKMKVRVGKIIDLSILKDIKNNESRAWKRLLNYSKTANTIVNETVIYGNSSYYTPGSGLVKYSQLEDNQYYFLYVELEDENGKYYPVEGVTLALSEKEAEIGSDGKYHFYLFFYDTNNFKWNLQEDLEEENPEIKAEETKNENVIQNNTTKPKDNTIAKGNIPYTGGMTIAILSIAIIAIAGTIAYIKNKDLKGV